MQKFKIGEKIVHEDWGKGTILLEDATSYAVKFERNGKVCFVFKRELNKVKKFVPSPAVPTVPKIVPTVPVTPATPKKTITEIENEIENRFLWIFNDGGRKEAGYKGTTGDCVCRSLAIVTGKPYKELYDELAKVAYESECSVGYAGKLSNGSHPRTGIYTRRLWFKKYMESLGFKWISCETKEKYARKKYFTPKHIPQNGMKIIVLPRHYTVLINGEIHDTYDCSEKNKRKTQVLGYWIKED